MEPQMDADECRLKSLSDHLCLSAFICGSMRRSRQIVATVLVTIFALLNSACADETSAPQAPAQELPGASQQTRSPGAGDIPACRLEPAFPRINFMRPVFITHAGDGTNRLFVVEQSGRILIVENRSDAEQTEVFLDIREKVRRRHNEEGLLSLVFHPKYTENGRFFVYYSASSPKRNIIARFNVSADNPNRADPSTEQSILEVPQPYGNHNGSTLLFGPDGLLYASFGDGGLANDPELHGQNPGTLLATIIRIDVDRTDGDRQYAIPPDNPFVNRSEARGEVWAYGLRNVWRMSFDRQTGELWAGDVGQDAWEEIDLIVKGGNYGWALREGSQPFLSGIRRLGEDFQPPDPLMDPVIEYSHREGQSVTGGYVYRGKRFPRLQGVYVYADYVTRTIWGLRHENGRVAAHRILINGPESTFVSSFGEDADGELYICGFDRLDGGQGRVYRLTSN